MLAGRGDVDASSEDDQTTEYASASRSNAGRRHTEGLSMNYAVSAGARSRPEKTVVPDCDIFIVMFAPYFRTPLPRFSVTWGNFFESFYF